MRLLTALLACLAINPAFALTPAPHGAPVKPAAGGHAEPTAISAAPAASGHGGGAGHGGGHWEYRGLNGPDAWADLSPANKLCRSGREQSPINISASFPQDLNKLEFSYGLSKINIVNNGHTIQVNYDPGSYLRIGDDRYELLQFHFHTPSEEMINSKQYAMVAHLVHKSEDGRLAVIAALFEKGKENEFINTLWSRLPREAMESRVYGESEISATSLLPLNLGYFTFNGSLTTPPCSEGVRWLVLKNPVQISARQLEKFRELYPMNARPIQPLYGRTIFESM